MSGPNVEGLSLLMSTADVVAAAATLGWTTNIQPGVDGRYAVAGALPVDTVTLKFERDQLVMFRLQYSPPQPEKAKALAESLPLRTEVPVISSWGAFTADRDVAMYGDLAGSFVTVTHLLLLSNQAEIDGVWKTYGAGVTRPAKA